MRKKRKTLNDLLLSEPVRVEYDSLSGRKVKTFTDDTEAAIFYRRKVRAGAHPTILAVPRDRDDEEKRAIPVTGVPRKHKKKRGGWRNRLDSNKGVLRVKDVGWTAKKVAVYRALKELGAVSTDTAVDSKKVITLLRSWGETMPPKSVRHYLYHGVPAGYVRVEQIEGWTGYAYHLTEEGAALDLDALVTPS